MRDAVKKGGSSGNSTIMCHNCGSVGHPPQFCTVNAVRIFIDAEEGDVEATLFHSSNNWTEGQPMRYIPYRKQFECVKFFPPGTHKFKINFTRSEWRCSRYFPTFMEKGNLNNFLKVSPTIQEVALVCALEQHLPKLAATFPALHYPDVVVSVVFILRKTSLASMLQGLSRKSFNSIELWGSWNMWSAPQRPHNSQPGKVKTHEFFLELEPRCYTYKFNVDGEWVSDPYRASGTEDGFSNHEINIAEEINKELLNSNVMYGVSAPTSIKCIRLEGLPVASVYSHSMTIIGEEIFIFGGKVRDSLSNSLYVVSRIQGKVKTLEKSGENSPQNLVSHKSIAYGQKLIVLGFRNGNMQTEFYVYCTLAKKWFNYVFSQTPIRFEHYSLAGKKGGAHFYVYGGYAWCDRSSQEVINDKIFLFSIPTMKFKQLPVDESDMPSPRFHHSAVFIEWDMVVFGGCRIENEKRLANNELWAIDLFNRQNLKWRKIESCGSVPQPRYGHTSEALGYKLFIYGGVVSSEAGERIVGDIWCWSARSSTWHEIALDNSLLNERAFSTMVSIDNELFIFGGKTAKNIQGSNPENMLLRITF